MVTPLKSSFVSEDFPQGLIGHPENSVDVVDDTVSSSDIFHLESCLDSSTNYIVS